MKKTILLLLAVFLAVNLQAQDNMKAAQQAVATFLRSFAGTVSEDNYKMFGLRSPAEAKQLQAGQVFSVKIIKLDDLKRYEGGEVSRLLSDVGRFICTIRNQETQQTTGIADLEYQKESFVVKGYSGSEIAKAFDRVDKRVLDQNFSVVRIPALNVYFGAFSDADNQLNFVSLQDSPTLQTEVGDTRPAAEFVKLLVPLANNYNGLPW